MRNVLSVQLQIQPHRENFTRMILVNIPNLLILLNILSFILSGLPYSHEDTIDGKVLNVGEELWKETLLLQMGSRLYQLEGLKSHTWYEVKISYPASIPSSFSLLLTRDKSSLGHNRQRKLLNTEKLIFKTDEMELPNDQGGMYVLVTVEPEGIVAIPNVLERKEVVFNIVCDELLLGIPRYAWWVVILVLLCLGLALGIPFFLPSYLLSTNQHPQSGSHFSSKDS
ncbi:GATA zinc finger domain-containing protein [Actinidia chinensis var. chinensis]|uniref:GATA zinc finger domain-containing protein n=1 Tax=Actinidia chinensis var. chinensis TaxID=1590841 RepID=A0A2R6PD72_ACTCC|nr:GATA zinc finger domain-containing protein [Actinidia chinensis var. chinensis]